MATRTGVSILVTLASNAIHNRVRGSATEIIAFRTTEDMPLAWFASQGFNPDEVRMLPKFHYQARVAGREETTLGRVA